MAKDRLPLPALVLRLTVAHATLLAAIVALTLAFSANVEAALLHAAAVYAFAYIIGLGMVTALAATLRGIAEHHRMPSGDAAGEGEAALRTLRCNWLTSLAFGAWGFSEHAAHHARPGIPAYHLPVVTAALARQGPGYDYGPGYLAVLARLI